MMNASDFYKTSSDQGYPLILLNSAQIGTLNQSIQNSLRSQQFTGKLGDVAILCDANGFIVQTYIGIEQDSDVLAIMHAVHQLPSGDYAPQMPLSHQAMLAWSLAQYRFDQYKPASNEKRVLCITESDLSVIKAESSAVFLVRDLINRPANDLNPETLAKVMVDMGEKFGAKVTQYVGDELLSNGFPAIHAVGRAAMHAPRLVILTWGEADHPKVTLVGKGVCFDSGGLDIKPSSNMRLMKKDMGGAAQVIGLAQWMMERRLPIRLQVLVPAVENAISSCAYRPGDVLTMRNGLTVEIDNTDAEGRLVLADALVKACEEKPELLIDFATLTGAARVAVGTGMSALFTNDDSLSNAFMASSLVARDPVWRMPLFDGYADMLSSNIADMVNSPGSSYAGAITAALFLKRFVTPETVWAHFDIMAWNVSSKPGKPEGGEAMGMQTVGRYLLNRYG